VRLDLTGRWDGTYRYSDQLGPETPFVAVLSESGARFSGEIIEPDEFRPQVIRASIEGIRAGHTVEFTKTYRGGGEAYATPVDYSGRLSSDGRTITGYWLLVELAGTFEMRREEAEETPELAEAVERKASTR